MDSIVAEVSLLAEHGTREVILVAQDTTSWGIDLPGRPDLADLLQSLDHIGRDFWIRIMYAHPAFLTDRQIEAMAKSPKMVPYIDMPLQHISDRMLTIMNRHTTKAATQAKIDRLRAAKPGMALRTTFIVGHPGETEADFEELLEFAESNAFERMGAFPYSSEEGTPAARMAEVVADEIAHERIARLMDAYDRWSAEQSVDKIGQTIPCLMESQSDGVWEGRTIHDAPEIDGRITVTDSLPGPGVYDILIESAAGVDLMGRAGIAGFPLNDAEESLRMAV
jgi:ribosomal protein S12 methylthiotransferase